MTEKSERLHPVKTLAVVGVGLLGGSVALAAKRASAVRVVGVGRDAAALEWARGLGILDEATTVLGEGVRDADLVVFCTPVDVVAGQVLSAAPHCRRGAVLTDVGSTKAAIVDAVSDRLPPGVAFVGSHPLAGSEKQGADHARADLFHRQVVIVTPRATTDKGALDCVVRFWTELGARVVQLDPEAHDRALALTSHLPHLVASALAGVLPPELAHLTATGFRDTTRLAAGDPRMWGAIFEANRDAVLAAFDRLTAQLARFRNALAANDRAAVERLLGEGKDIRDRLSR
jgi:prephenate dehydrogenase